MNTQTYNGQKKWSLPEWEVAYVEKFKDTKTVKDMAREMGITVPRLYSYLHRLKKTARRQLTIFENIETVVLFDVDACACWLTGVKDLRD